MRRVILMSAFLKMFVIKLVSLPKYVKGVHLCLVFSGFLLGVAVGCLGVGCVFVFVYREPIVPHDVMDGVQFFFIFVVLQAVGVQCSV